MGEVIKCVRDTAINGKKIFRRLGGYDCRYFTWHKPFGDILLLHSECTYNNNGWYKDCKHHKHPEKCPYFNTNKQIELFDKLDFDGGEL